MSDAIVLRLDEAPSGAPGRPATGTRRAVVPTSRDRTDQVHFRVVVWVTFPVFLLGAVARRLRPAERRGRAGVEPSAWREARAAARTCGTFALMG